MKKLKQMGIALILVLLLFSFATTVTLNFKPLFYYDMKALDLADSTGMSEEDIKENYDALISYNQFFGAKKLTFPTLPMSKSGRKHFVEVKQVFLFVEGVGIVCGILGIFLIWKKKVTKEVLKFAGILAIVIPIIFGILIAINWEWAFVTFHQIVFGNSDWLFDPVTDPVINMLPDEFFMHSAMMLIGVVVLGAMTCLRLSRRNHNGK